MYYDEVSETIIDAARVFESVTYVGDYDDTCGMLESIIRNGDYTIVAIDVEPEEYDGYNKEYSISIFKDELYVEKLCRGDRYLYEEADIVFVEEYLLDNKDLMEHISCENIVVIPDEDCCGCCGCEFCGECSDELEYDEEDSMPGFTFTKSDDNSYSTYSFYSDDKELVNNMANYVKKFFS